eukprot:6478993-Ditylum_brightwellii.AAC.1
MIVTVYDGGISQKEKIIRIQEVIKEFINGIASNRDMKDVTEKIDDVKYTGPPINVILCPSYRKLQESNYTDFLIEEVEIDYQYQLITSEDYLNVTVVEFEKALNEYIASSGVLACTIKNGLRSLYESIEQRIDNSKWHRRLDLVAIDSSPPDQYIGT